MMVKRFVRLQQITAIMLALLLALPLTALAKDGKKYFKQGVKYEENRQWDKAAEQFALAAAEKPSNIEYQLHLQRALVNAGAMLVERGDLLAEKKDYNAAYQVYRQAFAYDRANELALIKMRRMLEAQGLPLDGLPSSDDPSGPQYKLKGDVNKASSKPGGAQSMKVQLPGVPSRKFRQTDVIYRGDNLMTAIEQLAQTIGVNVVFEDQTSNLLRSKKLVLELRGVTYPKALEIILKTNNLMYSQIDTRTIVIAQDNPANRTKYDPHYVRTFYLKNADANEVRTALQQAFQGTGPAKPMIPIKHLNALIVRDTLPNLELVSSLIDSLDKSKAEVLIDVNIYEVSHDNMVSLGNQFNPSSATSRGLVNPGLNLLGGIGQNITGGTRMLTGPLGFGLGIPTSAISFFQDRNKAKLLASTQVHAFDNEANSIRIGQRVPIVTASYPTGFAQTPQTPNQNPNQNPNGFGGNFGLGLGAEQVQYENVGLNIDVTPNVFEDEIQLKMKIETSSVDNPNSGRPVFSQRAMQSMARIKDGQATLIAGVSQTTEAKGYKGVPVLGLVPILGRFFATPSTSNRQSDVVITVTPHILRRADIRDEDHLAKGAGTGQDSNAKLSIEEILYYAEVEEAEQNQVAGNGAGEDASKMAANKAAASTPTTSVPAAQTQTQNQTREGVVVLPVPTTVPASAQRPANSPKVEQKVVDRPGQEERPKPQAATDNDDDDDDDDDDEEEENTAGTLTPVQISVRSASSIATKGQVFYVAVIVNGNHDVSMANVALSFDPNVLEVQSVRDGGMLRSQQLQFHAEGGLLTVQLERPQGTPGTATRGQLLLVAFNVKSAGQSPLTLNDQQTFLRTPNGQLLPLKIQSTQVEAR